jgi:hypothetical protein
MRRWIEAFFTGVTEAIDRRVRWYRLPRPLALVSLIGLRIVLRRRNLYDTAARLWGRTPPGPSPHDRTTRTLDGTYNDLENPAMGSIGTRFGRNAPLSFTYPDTTRVLTPNPRTVSRELLTRDRFVPATSLNMLAAAWLQFMIHDWLSHGKNEKDRPWEIPIADDDPWHERPMRILRTREDPTRLPEEASLPPTYANTETHWWDASQIYGTTREFQERIRTGKDGKLIMGPDGLIPLDPTSLKQLAGVSGNWWIGLALLHTVFMREHNAICDRLRAEYPSWSDEELFQRARLVNAALLAKIHTVEWTPAILGNPTMRIAMRANWWGIATERVSRLAGRISDSEVISGIPGGPKEHDGVPYSLTEEFVAVYRMHPLIPDDFAFRSAADDHLLQERSFPEVADKHAQELLQQIPMTDLLYSFGTSHPGAITLHNYPRFLQRREEPDGSVIDLASIDILRSRERGVPRYNTFRELLHLPRVTSFEELTDNPEWAAQLRRVYNDDINLVDVTIGLYAETPPPGFGFSDTAFRIFILMASRRLRSDRFFTTDFTPRVYTQAGMDWIADNDMVTVLLRHYPALRPALHDVKNAFAPWARASA